MLGATTGTTTGGTHLIPFSVEYIPRMKRDGKNDRIGDTTESRVLIRYESEINDDPEDQSRSHFVEGFDVESTDTRVERTSNEPLR